MAKLTPVEASPLMPGQSRRSFVKGLSQSAAVLGLSSSALTSCATTESGGQDPGTRPDIGDNPPDAAVRVDSTSPSAGPEVSLETPVTVTKGPWVMPLEGGGIAIRFETIEDCPVPVRLSQEDGRSDEQLADRRPVTYTVEVPVSPLAPPDGVLNDTTGIYVIHTARFEGVSPDTRCQWSVPTGPDSEPMRGSFLSPPITPKAITLAWISDTMWPNNLDTEPVLSGIGADFVLHGGDVQYASGLVDSWNSYFDVFRDVFRSSLVSWCVGNHEFEWGDGAEGEYTQYYLGLLAPPDPSAPAPNYRQITLGAVRILVLDSETDYEASLDDPEGPQRQWFEAALAEASRDDTIRTTIVALHRPLICFGKHRVMRDRLAWMHPLFLEHHVSLVLCGHNHAYERFERDGLTYVTDGGGGALLYSVTKQLEEGAVTEEEQAWRQAAEMSHGVIKLDVTEDGGLTVTRLHAPSGDVTDTVFISPKA